MFPEKERINQIQIGLFDIKGLVNEKLKQNSETINLLHNKIKTIEESMQIQQNQINILIDEIVESKHKSKNTEKK